MMNYIFNKKAEKDNVNDFEDLKSIGKVAWDFILAIYKSGLGALIADSNSNSSRNKVSAKFTLKIKEHNASKSDKGKSTDKLATINKFPPLILAKLPKEINDIAKFFKKNKQLKGKDIQKKSYTQVSTPVNNTRKVLKIKETFPNL